MGGDLQTKHGGSQVVCESTHIVHGGQRVVGCRWCINWDFNRNQKHRRLNI